MLLAVAEHQHKQSDLIPRIATGFCGGLAHTGGMCGAVSGGIMAISLSFGRNLPTDPKDQCYQAEREFMEMFYTQFGELNCLKLTGVHLGTTEGQAAFKEKDQIKLCTEYVGKAVQMVLEVVADNKAKVIEKSTPE